MSSHSDQQTSLLSDRIREYVKLKDAVFMDIQYVNDEFGNWFIKELGVLEPNCFTPAVYFFKPCYISRRKKPTFRQKIVEQKINEFNWNDGILDYNKVYYIKFFTR